MKKTINVKSVVESLNEVFAKSICDHNIRIGQISVIEQILHKSGNYKGFRYLLQHEVPVGELPGVRYDSNGEILPYPERFNNTDPTRVEFFV